MSLRCARFIGGLIFLLVCVSIPPAFADVSTPIEAAVASHIAAGKITAATWAKVRNSGSAASGDVPLPLWSLVLLGGGLTSGMLRSARRR